MYQNIVFKILIIITILLIGCENNPNPKTRISENQKQELNQKSETFSIENSTSLDFLKAKEKFVSRILYDTSKYRKVDNEFRLPIEQKWKKFLSFKDTLVDTDDSNIKEYFYVGQFEQIGHYIVGGSFWEFSEFYLIDKKTGKKTAIWDFPSISPKNKFIANLSMAYGLEGNPNGIQIWQINYNTNNKVEPISISKYLEIDQQNWVPVSLVFESDNSLILKVAKVDKFRNENGKPEEKDYYYLRLRIQ